MSTIVIVGAGSAGMTLAWRLAENPSNEVILVDSGVDPGVDVSPELRRAMLLPPEFYWAYFEAETGAFLPRGRVFGGSSAANAAAAVRGQPWCFDEWEVPGWAWEDCLPAFIGLEDDQQFGTDDYHGSSGPIPITRFPTQGFDAAFEQAYSNLGYAKIQDHNAPGAFGYGPWPTNRTGEDRASTLLQMLPALRERSNVSLRPSSEVTEVVFDGARARGVRLDTPAGPELVESDLVVLSGGSFGTPEILFNSGIGAADNLRAAGATVLADAPGVGENLADHAFLQMEVEVVDPTRHAMGAGQGTLLTYELDGPGRHAAHLFAYQTSFFDAEAPNSRASVTSALMSPKSRGRLDLKLGSRAGVRLAHYTDEEDIARGVAIIARASEVVDEVEATGLIELPTDPWWKSTDLESKLREVAITYHHPVGTCRMGVDDQAVVDPNLMVRGVEGLMIADASVFPSLPRATTNLATMMIGWRAADLINDVKGK